MKLTELKCKECGAILTVNDELKKVSCNYCGAEFVVDNEGTKHTYVKIDEAELKRAETERLVRLKQLENVDKKHAEKRVEFKRQVIKWILIAIACLIGYFLLFEYPFASMKNESIQQENELQQLVDEIMVDVENEKFDEAYMKAQLIIYTENWSSEVEEKWEKIRKEVINYIIEQEKKVTGKSNHKPEKDGWFN